MRRGVHAPLPLMPAAWSYLFVQEAWQRRKLGVLRALFSARSLTPSRRQAPVQGTGRGDTHLRECGSGLRPSDGPDTDMQLLPPAASGKTPRTPISGSGEFQGLERV